MKGKFNFLKRIGFMAFVAAFNLLAATAVQASSHREAPLISNDPLADNTDLYAFRSPEDPNRVIIVANYIPFESPEGGQIGIRSAKTSDMKFISKTKQPLRATILPIVLLLRK